MLVCIFIFIFVSGLFQANQVSSFILTPTQQCILKDFSWKLKVKILNNLLPNGVPRRGPVIQALVYSNTTRNHFNDFKQRKVDIQYLTLRKNNVQLAKALKRNVGMDFLIKGPVSRQQTQRIDKESSMSLDEKSDTKNLDFEAMGVHDGLQADHNTDVNKKKLLYRRKNAEVVKNSPDHIPDEAEIERNMKLKLFRLMYDTVKDNDDLIRKADNIKKKYDNSTYFEIGFIMGAITDKVNTMSEVALTVERLYDDWKPIEHVNAYEQIANQAIEINHLVDILLSIHKKTDAVKKEAPAASGRRELSELKAYHELKGFIEDALVYRKRDMDSKDRTL